MQQSLASVAVGLVAGLVIASLGLQRVLGAMLFGIRPTDPWMLATVAAVILGVGVLATQVPAHQATRVDPLRSLRQD
jgi:ABC-type antimicrobial peptide transport system permease subunit